MFFKCPLVRDLFIFFQWTRCTPCFTLFHRGVELIKTDFGPKCDSQLKELVPFFCDSITPGFFPHRDILAYKVRLTAYSKRHCRNRLALTKFEDIKRPSTDLFKHGLMVPVYLSLYVAPTVMVRKPDGSIRVYVDYKALNKFNMKDSLQLSSTPNPAFFDFSRTVPYHDTDLLASGSLRQFTAI